MSTPWQPRQRAPGEGPEMPADVRPAEQHRREARLHHPLDQAGEAADQLLGEARLDHEAAAAARAQLLGDLALDPRVQAQHLELVTAGAQAVADDVAVTTTLYQPGTAPLLPLVVNL